MSGRVIGALSLALALAATRPAAALTEPADAGATETESATETEAGGAGLADQEIGGRLGLRMGGRTTPGGFTVGGVYLYRITDTLWSDSAARFVIGGGGAKCFRDRQDLVVCDHGQLDGVGGGVHSGLRWAHPGKQGFVPYVRATIGLELVNFADDEVRGLAIPLTIGGGVRARVADRISVVGGAELHLGFARLSRDVGTEPQAAMVVELGVDFAL